jgi:outer membrane immunogenic protein
MRRWFVSLCLLGLSPAAYAADFGTPRAPSAFGPPAPFHGRWSGLYGGGQIGYGTARMDFRNAFDSSNIFDSTDPFTGPLGSVSDWAVFGSDKPSAVSYGAFIGFNSQWEDAVIGVEFNYNHTSLKGSASDSICYHETDPACGLPRTLGDSNDYNVTINAAASAHLTDYATFRARAGWAYGDILPYVMVGLAVGRVETVRTATATGELVGGGGNFVHTESAANTRYPWGYAAGAGIDFLLWPNVFVRGEYEFVHLNNATNIDLDLHTARVAVGLKF